MTRSKRTGGWARGLGGELIRATSLGWDLALPIFLGVLLGHYLDRWLETGYIFTVGLLFLGAAVGFFNVWRFGQRIGRRAQGGVAEEQKAAVCSTTETGRKPE